MPYCVFDDKTVLQSADNFKFQVHNFDKEKCPSIMSDDPSWLKITLPWFFANAWIRSTIQAVLKYNEFNHFLQKIRLHL
jgi:hypothetical protein